MVPNKAGTDFTHQTIDTGLNVPSIYGTGWFDREAPSIVGAD